MTNLFATLRFALTVADMASHARYIYGLTAGFISKYGPPIAYGVRRTRIGLAAFIAPKNILR